MIRLPSPIVVFCLVNALILPASFGDVIGLDGRPLATMAEANAELAKARAALESGNLQECRELTQKFTEKHSDLPHPDVIVCRWLIDSGYVEDAKRLIEETASTVLDSQDVHIVFAEIASLEGRRFDAWTHYKAALVADPRATWSEEYRTAIKAAIWLGQAKLASERSDWNTARQLYERLLDSKLHVESSQLGLGQVAIAENNLSEAETHFRTAADLNPRLVPELLMAQLLSASQRTQDAELWWKKALAAERESGTESDGARTESGVVPLKYANWLLRNNRPDELLAFLNDSQFTESQRNSFVLLIALANQMKGEHGVAVRELSRMSRQDPSDVFLSNRLALSLVESSDEGQRSRALQIAQANIKLVPNSLDLASALAWIQLRLGDLDAAAQTCVAVLNSNGPLSRDSAFFLAQVLSSLDRQTESARLLQLAEAGKGEFYYQHWLTTNQPPIEDPE